ncbi:MAG: ATP-binding protein [Prevotella sp.]|nr:ATP-binding protein [Prevotella sp.]
MMHNKEMILSTPWGSRLIADKLSRIVEMVNRPVNLLRQYYAQVLERDLNMHQTWALIEAQVAFFLGVMPVGYAFVLRAVALLWLVVAVKKCRRLLA